MKAVICKTYGPPEVLRIENILKPSIQNDEVLIRVYAASVKPHIKTNFEAHFNRFTQAYNWLSGNKY